MTTKLGVPVRGYCRFRCLPNISLFSLLLTLFGVPHIHAQGNYEVQVYGADTVAPHVTMFELHSNFTIKGSDALKSSQFTSDGTEPTRHALHETLEITQGIADWAEVGFYVFSSYRAGAGWEWVGDHIRPRVRVPDKWHWPIGVSLSNELGYQRSRFSTDTWTWEIRPIIDKKFGPWYLAFNPALDRSWHGPSVRKGVEFSPNFKVAYDVYRSTGHGYPKVVSAGLEYYGALGPLNSFDLLHDQQQQFVPAIDLDVSSKWEINFGAGIGTTRSTDHLLIKGILGRRFSWYHRRTDSGTSKGDEQKPNHR